MLKCPLCGFENPESTESCFSCGALLQSAPGLARDRENPNCYTFVPGQKIAKGKRFEAEASGIDLVYKFCADPLIVPMIAIKVLIFFILVYETMKILATGNTGFYTLVPLTILYFIGILGWSFMYYGGKRKNRTRMGYGIRMLYAYHIIGLAYLFMTLAVIIYFVIAMSTANELYGFMQFAFENAVSFSISMVVFAALVGFFILINGNFFDCLSEMLTKNTVVFYRFTMIIPAFFVLAALIAGSVTAVSVVEGPYEIASEILKVLKENINIEILKETPVFVGFTSLATLSLLFNAIKITKYIYVYRKYFVPKKIKKTKKNRTETEEES